MVCKDTLRFKYLPKELSDAQKEDFVRHFGAQKVKVITSKAKSMSIVYAKFETEEIAKNVMFRLHQMSILNCRLCVEYAETDILQGQLTFRRVNERQEGPNKSFFKTFINNINAFNDSVGFYQPPPAHLKYNYPKPNRATINNIAHALATVPRFYTQVLHLMNKMNLPPPFAVPEHAVQTMPPVVTSEKRKQSSSESELESEEEEKKPKEIIPEKRVIGVKRVAKKPKLLLQPTVISTNVNKSVERVENVFEKVELQTQKKIELKLASEVTNDEPVAVAVDTINKEVLVEKPSLEEPVLIISQPEIEPPQVESNTNEADVLEPSKQDSPVYENPSSRPMSPEPDFPCISLEELRANQVTDLSVMAVFKNYSAGEPTNKLYIKNCAKTVVLQDLEYIYNRYREDANLEKPSEFNIRLMQEGRMKGQAFVTLDSAEQAQRAVTETNGFILKDKPLVVVFGKAGKKK